MTETDGKMENRRAYQVGKAVEVSATIANGALDPTAREACLRRDLSRVRDHLRAALKGTDQ